MISACGRASDMKRGFGDGVKPPIGIRVIDSVPAQMKASPMPLAI
jgi:hypothetical protein